MTAFDLSGLPVRAIPEVYHFGTMIPTHLNPTNYEGDMLSISHVPADWVRIARLQSDQSGHQASYFALECPDALFIDYHEFMADSALQEAGLQWATSQGLLEARNVWIYEFEDAETEEIQNLIFLNEEEALEEADGDDEAVTSELRFVLTDAAIAKFSLTERERTQPDYAFFEFFREVIGSQDERIKGVWWTDRHEPEIYSAPRGGIFRDRVADFELFLTAYVPEIDPFEFEQNYPLRKYDGAAVPRATLSA